MFYFLKYILLVGCLQVIYLGQQLMHLNPISKKSYDALRLLLMAVLILWIFRAYAVYGLIGAMIYYYFHKLFQVKKRQRLIEFYGYKIFKFLMNQISSGILISDALQSIYRIVDEKHLRKTLIEVSAYYSKTTNLHDALNILKKSYKGLEVDTLCMAIEQGIYTGANYETLKKMEQLLFKRYIYQIKLETKWRKKRSILSVLLLCSILVLMISIPVFLDMIKAFNQIFFY